VTKKAKRYKKAARTESSLLEVSAAAILNAQLSKIIRQQAPRAHLIGRDSRVACALTARVSGGAVIG